jgi:hypothetical protein
MPPDEESRLLCCVQCGQLFPGSRTQDGDLIPNGTVSGGRCHECGGEEFEQVTLSSE